MQQAPSYKDGVRELYPCPQGYREIDRGEPLPVTVYDRTNLRAYRVRREGWDGPHVHVQNDRGLQFSEHYVWYVVRITTLA